jgi:hypothetical protein
MSQVRRALKRAGSSKESLQRLIQQPEEFAKEAGLSKEGAAFLRGADLVIAVTKNPLAGANLSGTQTTTTSPVTITVTRHHGMVSGDPPNIDQLNRVALIRILRQALISPEYSEQLRETLKFGQVDANSERCDSSSQRRQETN